METPEKQRPDQAHASPSTSGSLSTQNRLPSNETNTSGSAPQDAAFNRDRIDGNQEGKTSHDSGISSSNHPASTSGATTPTSRTSMDTSSDLFHATTLKVHVRDAEALNKARQAFSPASPSDLSDAESSRQKDDGLSSVAAVPAPLTEPIPSSPPSGAIYKSRMPVNLGLRAGSQSSSISQDMPLPSRSSPLRQSTTFDQEQLALLDVGHSTREEVEMLVSPSKGNALPRSNSLPIGVRANGATPPSSVRYADANESMPPSIEEAAFSNGRPLAERARVSQGPSRSNSASGGRDTSSVS